MKKIFISAFFCGYISIQAQEIAKDTVSTKLINLNEVVLSANKTEEKKSDIPFVINVIDKAQIEFQNPQNSADMLQNTGGVFVQKSQMGGGSPVLRGFEANRVLIVIDGVRMNNAIYRAGHLQDVITIDNSMLERTEVLFGPSSVMYGSDAIGGVMHFYTKKPLFSWNEKMFLKINAFTRYSSANNEKTAHTDFNLGFRKIASLTSITYSDFDDMKQGGTGNNNYYNQTNYYAERYNDKDSMVYNKERKIQKFSGYSQFDLMQKLTYNLSEGNFLGANIQFSKSSNIPRYDRLQEVSGGKLKFAEWNYGPQQRFMGSLYTQLGKGNSIYDNAQITGAYQKITQERISRRFNKNLRKTQTENVDVISLNADFHKKVKEKHELSYGLEFVNNNVDSKAEFYDIVEDTSAKADTRYPNGGNKMLNAAIYLSDSWEYSDNIILSAGLRGSMVSLKSNFGDTTFFKFPFKNISQNNTAINGNLGIVLKSSENVQYHMLFSTGFKAPNIDDLTKVFESGGGILIVPNSDLKPEYAYNIEAGFSWLLLKNKVRLEGNAFYTMLDNAFITRDYTYVGNDSVMYDGTLSKIYAMQNTAKAFVYGTSGSIAIDFCKYLSANTTLTYTYGRYQAENGNVIPLDHIPPVFGKTSLIFRYKKFTADFYAIYNDKKQLKDYSPSGEDNLQTATVNGMPAWTTWNIKTSYAASQNISFHVGIENISDVQYRTFASGISAPGRNVVVAVRAKF